MSSTTDKSKVGCGKTFAEFHPDFMAQLPNILVEQFPFLVTPSGLGIHRSMMLQFLHLCTKGILFGTFCNGINEMKKYKYWTSNMCYLDRLSDVITNPLLAAMGMDEQVECQPSP